MEPCLFELIIDLNLTAIDFYNFMINLGMATPYTSATSISSVKSCWTTVGDQWSTASLKLEFKKMVMIMVIRNPDFELA